MENSIFTCKSKPPRADLFKHEIPSEFSSKPSKSSLSFTKTSTPVASRPSQKISEHHVNHLCKTGQLKEAVAALDSIAKLGTKVKPATYISLLQCCIDLDSIDQGRKLHARIGLVRELNPFIETKLVGMYAKCGSLEDARQVFDQMLERNLFTWSTMIGAYARERRWREIIDLFFWMIADGIFPDEFLLPKILQACANSGDAESGELIHSFVIRGGMDSCVHVNNALLSMYAKCGRLISARSFFEKMDKKDRVSWNSIISGYCQSGQNEKALQLFEKMQVEGVEPGLVTWNILIASYNQSGDSDLAMELMRKMEILGITPDVFTWTSMISGYAQNNRKSVALELFREMILVGVEPNAVTVASAVSACATLKALEKGKQLHSIGIKTGYMEDVLFGNSLIDLYSKCSKIESAQRIFDNISEKDIFTWNSMIGGYTQSGYCGKAYDLFVMMQDSGLQPNVVTWNVMISGHIQNGDEDRAMEFFQRMETDGMIKQNTVTWNLLVSGMLQNGHINKALEIFRQMQSFQVPPNSVTLLSILPAFANLVALKKVKEIHGCILRRSLNSELSLANSLIDAYAKSGDMVYARAVFEDLSSTDIISWNSIMSGYVLHGLPDVALDLFGRMRQVGLNPSRGTITHIILAYSLKGMVDEGKQIFSSIIDDYQISPNLEHFSAVVTLFGRSGRLGEATTFIEDVDFEPDSTVWDALLTACRVHGSIGLAVQAAEHLMELEPGNPLHFRLVSQIYALVERSEDTSNVRKPKMINGTTKFLGSSWIEIKNTVHTFITGDKSMPNSDSLYSQLSCIAEKIRVAAPKSHDTQLCIEEEENEEVAGIHSEKLAIAFALIGSPYSSKSIRIVKNLRMCRDCHRTAKLFSLVYGREIYLRDPKCLHHFKNGQCSCRDYW
ncbi:pentatricopeptide repeat-containing protein At1g19720 [Macadamia integrifolia]|uniref:pentatricopeptide repeat-containing protein At1g19720 n=1 Tax=Macadamia integrifolia TaxID=60698 RepID=UPI001C4E89D6|nr:pentatricopeptide repeat-containing protein At1g19720 [Macadamia integrifolia]